MSVLGTDQWTKLKNPYPVELAVRYAVWECDIQYRILVTEFYLLIKKFLYFLCLILVILSTLR